MKRFLARPVTVIGLIMLVLIVFCCHNYVWQGDFADSIEGGLSNVFIAGQRVSVRSQVYDFCIPGEDHSVNLEIHNPAKFALACSVSVSDPGLVTAPVVTVTGTGSATLSFSVTEAAEGKRLLFTVSTSAPAEGRTFDDCTISLPCHYPAGTGVDATVSIPDPASGHLSFSPSSASVLQTDAAYDIGADSSVTVPGGTVWAWYVDGVVQPLYTISSFHFDATTAAVGAHTVSATADTGTVRYSGSMLISVVSVVTSPKYTVSYDVSGGDAVIANALYTQGATVTASAGAGTRPGYAFSVWSTTDVDSGGAQTTYGGGATFTMPGNNVNLTAIWTIVHSPVTGLGFSTSDGSIGLFWTDPDSPALLHIAVEWYPTVAGIPVLSSIVAPGAEGFLATGLANGTGYTFRITAVYVDTIGSAAEVLTATPAVP